LLFSPQCHIKTSMRTDEHSGRDLVLDLSCRLSLDVASYVTGHALVVDGGIRASGINQ
jgi:hypothetical protein